LLDVNAKHKMSSPDLTIARVLAFSLNERQLASPSCTVSIGFTLVSFSLERNATLPRSKVLRLFLRQAPRLLQLEGAPERSAKQAFLLLSLFPGACVCVH
jgi:hypothetical protein